MINNGEYDIASKGLAHELRKNPFSFDLRYLLCVLFIDTGAAPSARIAA